MKKRKTIKTSSVKKSLLKMLAGAVVGAVLGGFLGFAHFALPAESSATIGTLLRSFLSYHRKSILPDSKRFALTSEMQMMKNLTC